jgi:hypothetical protein
MGGVECVCMVALCPRERNPVSARTDFYQRGR